MSSRSGSHAGRGFRYQDAIAAWLSVRSWTNAAAWGLVIPEGGDDVELRSAECTIVQVKSRRAHLGAFPVGDVARFVEDLWARHDKAAVQPSSLLLVLERSFAEGTAADGAEQAIPQAVMRMLSSDTRAQPLLGKSRIIAAPSPQEAAIGEIIAKGACTPLAAQLCYADLLAKVGKLADENGVKQPAQYEGLSRSDVDAAITDLLGAIDPVVLEQAIADGVCEPVDFLTPLNDPNFYLGVDVEPGHLAAGLVAERPIAREAVARALEERGNALVVGPSGAGKSAVMWDAVRMTRHTVRWFRVRRSDALGIDHLARHHLIGEPMDPAALMWDREGGLAEC